MAFHGTNDSRKFQQACIDSANRLIKLCGLSSPRITSISKIKSTFFITLFERITGYSIPDLVLDTDSIAEVHNVQVVIDTLSLDLLGLSLSHISGENVASGDPLAVLNLLEVLEMVFMSLSNENNESVRTSSKKRKSPVSDRSKSSSSVDSENVPPIKIPKTRIRKQTLKKPCEDKETEVQTHSAPSLVVTHEHTWDSHQQCISSTYKNGTKRESAQKKSSKSHEKRVQRPMTDKVEQLYESNFEKKLRNLLTSDKSPYRKSRQLTQNYLRSMKTPLKRKSIPVCRKSFLLPSNLRRSSSQQQSVKRTRKKSVLRSEREDCGTSKVNEKEGDSPAIIKCLLGEFPGFELPLHTQELMKKRYYQHLSHMHRQLRNTLRKKPTTLKQAEEAAAKQTRLSHILAKDLEQKQHLRELQEERASAYQIRGGLRDARIKTAKMRKYFNEFHQSMSSKMQQRNFTEDMIVERTFKEMLDLQKEKIRLLCQRVKETDKEDAKHHRQYLEALQHTYEQQLDLMAESLATEQREAFEADREKNLVVRKMSRELRDKLQKDVRSLQKDILELMRDTHFRELDAQNFIESIR